jgi:LPS-assembly lipoprotein
MWWGSARPALVAGLLAGLCLVVTACGFEPMYGESRGAAVQADLAAVRVALIPNRNGQLLRRYILDRIQTGNETAPALYQLEVALQETRQNYGIQRDLSATYARLVLSGNYLLRDIKTQKTLLSGSTYSSSSYNVAADPFNTVVAENDARERAVKTLGDDLITRLSLHLRNPPPHPS